MIKISGGKFRSRIIKAPANLKTVPTMGKTKLAIFNALGATIKYKIVLDLFAGSGAFGFECLSREASSVFFIDNDECAIKTIKANATNLVLHEEVIVIKDDVLSYLKDTNNNFDLIFMDPPYGNSVLIIQALKTIIERAILKENGIIIIESDEKLNLPNEYLLKFKKIKDYHHGLAYIKILWS